ncbi:hypothetical protein [Henriciella aquimarina]|uniref:hypothetical protein n=1 Tax=Henriciella aquimarina TaxID=545261 RepID=UPI00117AABBE|nr:hypothetical protein [Henriciella aquimarina]
MKNWPSLTLLGSVLLLASCANKPASEATSTAVSETRAGFADAAMTPLEDLNLKRDQIPDALQSVGNPYKVPADITCAEIEAQIITLNAVLGPDWDTPEDDGDDPTLSQRAGGAASDGVLGTVASEAGGIMPYRGWIRQLTGAKAHQKKIESAYERGSHRRTYLKALGLMKGCDPVAVPQLKPEEERQKIVFHGDAPAGYAAAQPAPEVTPTAVAKAPAARTDLRPAPVGEEALAAPGASQGAQAQADQRPASQTPRAQNSFPQPSGQLEARPAPSHDGETSSPADETSSPPIYD